MKRSGLGTVVTLAAAGAIATAVLRRIREESLRGEVAVVTGASRGLGFAIARELAREGCRLVICARDDAELRRAAESLAGMAEVVPVVCDVGDARDVARLIETALAYYGRLDIVVNNAGIIEVGPLDTMRIEDYERMMDVMFWGMVRTSLAALPAMRMSGHGRIVNITSIGGRISVPHLLPYSAAKFAAVGFSEGLHAEVARDGLCVTTVVPGLMRTGSYRHAEFKGDAEAEYKWFAVASTMPLLSMSGRRAARRIVSAMKRRASEVVLSAPAKLGAKAQALMPGTGTALLALISRLLPQGSEARAVEGVEAENRFDSKLFDAATVLGRRAGRDLHQVR